MERVTVIIGELALTTPLVSVSVSTGLLKNDWRVIPLNSRDEVFTVSENSSVN